MKRNMLMLVTGLALVGTAHAASFDCVKARTRVEKMVCGDAELSELDERMEEAYKESPLDRAQLKRWQIQWLRERNACSDVECIKKAYESRIFSLKRYIDRPANDYSVADALSAKGWDFVLHKGKAGTEDWIEDADDLMCQKIKQHMNEVAPDWHLDGSVTNRCTRAVRMAPFFSEPPWEELDPHQYEELIVRLMRFNHSQAEYFNAVPSKPGFDDTYFRKKANDFIAAGGHLQHWKVRLKESLYFPADGNDKPAPSGLQDVIQLRYRVDYSVDKRYRNLQCRLPDWDGSVFLVNHELSEPLRYLDGMSGKALLLYEGDPVLDDSGGDEISVGSPHNAKSHHSCRLINPKAHNQGM